MVTITDVAKAAGVSMSTVSYALSGKRVISERTRERIARAIDDLGYQPHAGARMLAGSTTQILALSAPLRADGHLPTHMRFVTAVVQAARTHDYDVLLLAADDEIDGIQRVASTSLVDAVVMMGVAEDDERLPLVTDLRVPSAFVGLPDGSPEVACVDLDFAAAARDSLTRLADLGHSTIGMIGHPRSYVDRLTGFIGRFDAALDEVAHQRDLTLVRRWAGIERGSGAQAIDEILAEAPDVTAVVLHCNEPVVEEVLRRLEERGLSIPDDFSLVAAAASYDPGALGQPLSGITLPIDEMCAIAVEAALAAVRGEASTAPRLLDPTYIDRGSTASRR